MNEELEQEKLSSMMDEAMDIIDQSDGEVLWVESNRGLMIIAQDSGDPMSANLIAELKQALRGTMQ
jgi:hypothetical protein